MMQSQMLKIATDVVFSFLFAVLVTPEALLLAHVF